MKEKAFTSADTSPRRCLVLGQESMVGRLQHLLKFTFTDVKVIENPTVFNLGQEMRGIDLLLVTDTQSGGLDPMPVEAIKSMLKPAAIICLAERVDESAEVGLRTLGLAFLGTYGTFMDNADDILKCAIKKRRRSRPGPVRTEPRPMGDRPRQALDLGKRLLNPARGNLRMAAAYLFYRTITLTGRLSMRAAEIGIGLSAIALLAFPVGMGLTIRYLLSGTPVFTDRFIAWRGQRLAVRRFNRAGALKDLPLFMALVTGRIALVGIPVTDWDMRSVSPKQGHINKIKPGIFSLWRIRQASRIAHKGRESVEWEYIYKKGVIYDLLLLLRAVPSLLYGVSEHSLPNALRILDLEIANLTMADAIRNIDNAAANTRSCTVFFVNPDCLNKTISDRAYFRILKKTDWLFPDGIGLTLAGKLLQSPLRENINGTDMLPFLCRMAAEKGYSLFLLGGRPGVADQASQRLASQYRVSIAGTAHGYFDDDTESRQLVDRINQSGADILLVGMGAPRQEKWIARHRHLLAPRVLMGVGGLFDFYSGNIKRAPVWMREIGLEWFFRIVQEPGRMWKRYVIGNPLFLYRVARWRFSARHRRLETGDTSGGIGRAVHGPVPSLISEKARADMIARLTQGDQKRDLNREFKVLAWRLTVCLAQSLKRGLDIVIAAAAMILLSPLFAVTAMAIVLENPGPVFYVQTRVGRNGRYFRFYKFRSMVVKADQIKKDLENSNESADGVIFKMKKDPRITRVGRIIRKFSIDELPQLVNVLKGDMSLVGPRPPLPLEVAQYTLEQRKRLHIRPGITCFWQVNGRSDIPFSDQVRLDLKYIQSTSLVTDLILLLKTIPAVLTGKGAY